MKSEHFFPMLSVEGRGGAIVIPMNSNTVAQPIGNVRVPPAYTSLEFGALVLIREARGSAESTSDATVAVL